MRQSRTIPSKQGGRVAGGQGLGFTAREVLHDVHRTS